ncbi:MAG: hypothetical protein J6N76_06185 [Lachnospiraceae bacterium]|nr:hypothetical protein [Lachnospiraceae bacterium]
MGAGAKAHWHDRTRDEAQGVRNLTRLKAKPEARRGKTSRAVPEDDRGKSNGDTRSQKREN